MRLKFTYSNVVATLALFIALGGTSYAVSALEKDSVRSKHIAKGAVKSSDVGKDAITSVKVKDLSLSAGDFAAGQLPAGPIGPAGPAGSKGATGPQGIPGLSGLERVYISGTENNSASPKFTTANCGPGKQAIGSGYDISGGKTGASPNGLADVIADVVLPSAPFPGGTGQVFVEAWEEEPTAASWSLDAIAICANVTL